MIELLLLSLLSQEALPPGATSRIQLTEAKDYFSIALSPDARLAATGHGDGSVRLWETASRKLLFEDPQKSGGVFSLAFSSDGSLLAAGANAPGRWILLFDVSRKNLLASPPPGAPITAIATSPDGKNIATGTDLGAVAVSDVATGRKIHSFRDKGPRITAVAYSPDGTRIAASDEEESVRVWDSTTGQELQKLPMAALCLAFSPDGKTLAIGGESKGLIVLVDVAAAREKARLQGDDFGVDVLSFSPDGRHLGSSEGYILPGLYIGPKPEHAVHVWDVATRKKLRRLSGGHARPVQSLVFRPDGTALVSASRDSTVVTWDLRKK